MNNEEEIKKIKCAVFRSRNEIIEKITDNLNRANEIKTKIRLAERLVKEAGQLLNCPQFNERKAECQICHKISELRKKMADLIIKSGRLK